MSISSQYFEAIADYGGVEGDTNYIAVMKGDVVRLIKKDKEWLTVEKDGNIGKVPKGILIQKENKISSFNMNLSKQTSQPVPFAKQSLKTQNKRIEKILLDIIELLSEKGIQMHFNDDESEEEEWID
ncbi:MAG: hypothetical protein EZS28_016642 [Streblomastix strix]|uniref:SH3 domain-containing protein n=3 Tax=Streblomastix strix TaxID=222440 RepID=A0A5J4VZ59_9EUKA|nr:MAG: hypothetical protein EZS28_016642 [Streblomastix strix]